MSIKMLDAQNAVDGKHSVQDDMESLLYVILYCALLWQPHNLTKDDLRTIVARFFDDCSVGRGGHLQGGDAKLVNSVDRRYTMNIRFRDAALDDWLLEVLNFHSPLPIYGNKYDGKWSDPTHLDTFWAEFLNSRSLERTNRHDHLIDDPSDDEDSEEDESEDEDADEGVGAGASDGIGLVDTEGDGGRAGGNEERCDTDVNAVNARRNGEDGVGDVEDGSGGGDDRNINGGGLDVISRRISISHSTPLALLQPLAGSARKRSVSESREEAPNHSLKRTRTYPRRRGGPATADPQPLRRSARIPVVQEAKAKKEEEARVRREEEARMKKEREATRKAAQTSGLRQSSRGRHSSRRVEGEHSAAKGGPRTGSTSETRGKTAVRTGSRPSSGRVSGRGRNRRQ